MTNDDQPSDQPSAVDRHLTDKERELMSKLAIFSVAEQTGVDAEEATRALDDLNQRVGFVLEGDAYDVYLKDAEHGHVIIHATREWLDYWAHMGIPLTREDLLKSRRQRPPRGNVN